jgi:hypothetical protein
MTVLATVARTVQAAEAPRDTAHVRGLVTTRDTSEVDLGSAAAKDSTEIRAGYPVIDTTAFRPATASSVADTTGFHVEIGATADFTNELFYEDAFVDTIALGRRLVGTPESRAGAVVLAALSGIRSNGTTIFTLTNEFGIGNKIQNDALGAYWRQGSPRGWQWFLVPTAEYRQDQTFDRNLEEARASATMRLRHGLAGASWWAEVAGTGEFLRTRGVGADFIPNRQGAGVGFFLDRAALLGPELHFGYEVRGRTFPDSTVRDHHEHRGGARWRQYFGAGNILTIESQVTRRATIRPAPTSRDNYWEGLGAVETSTRLGDATALVARLGAEGIRYDVQDSTVYFDYTIMRATVMPEFEHARWTLGIGPRGEWLASALAPAEEYREISGVLEFEWTPRGSWWTVTPAVGWRDYTEVLGAQPEAAGSAIELPSIHSSYAFYELGVIGDQALGANVRLRIYGSGRVELHTDDTQDTRSLYFSVDLRRLF